MTGGMNDHNVIEPPASPKTDGTNQPKNDVIDLTEVEEVDKAPTETDYDEFMKRLMQKGFYKCRLCSCRFNLNLDYQQHMKLHDKTSVQNDNANVKTDWKVPSDAIICNNNTMIQNHNYQQWVSFDELRVHAIALARLHHHENSICKTCGEVFITERDVRKHICYVKTNFNKVTNSRTIECLPKKRHLADKTNFQSVDLTSSKRVKYCTNIKLLDCIMCGEEFTDEKTMLRHDCS